MLMAYANLGNALFLQRRLEPASKCYEKLIEMDPTSSNAYNNLGSTWKALEKYDKA